MIDSIHIYLHNSTGKEELNKDTLSHMMKAANIQQPEWDKIGEKLGFKLLPNQKPASYFLEGWRTFANSVGPSWKLLGEALSKIKDYRHATQQIRQNDRKYKC